MLLPLEVVLRRGVIFLWAKYSRLDDPSLAGRTKPKFIVILSSSPQDDPIIYILTTSAKDKHAMHPFPDDIQRLPAGSYNGFDLETLMDAGDAGQLDIGRDELIALYQAGGLVYKDTLSEQHVEELMAKIAASRRVARRVKHVLAVQ